MRLEITDELIDALVDPTDDTLVALRTALLRELVRASRSTAETAVRQLQSGVRPLLVPAGVTPVRDGDRLQARIEYANVGSGPALIPMNARYRPARSAAIPQPAWRDGYDDIPRVIVAARSDALDFNDLDWPPVSIYAEVVYTDMNGEQPQRTTAYLAGEPKDGDPSLNSRGFKLERLLSTDRNADIDGDPVLSGDGWDRDEPGYFAH